MAFSLGVAIGSGVGYGINQTTHQQTPPATEVQHFNCTGYERLLLGMPLEEAKAILGQGIEISRSGTTATFVWENSDKSRITAVFKDGKLISKEQSKLK